MRNVLDLAPPLRCGRDLAEIGMADTGDLDLEIVDRPLAVIVPVLFDLRFHAGLVQAVSRSAAAGNREFAEFRPGKTSLIWSRLRQPWQSDRSCRPGCADAPEPGIAAGMEFHVGARRVIGVCALNTTSSTLSLPSVYGAAGRRGAVDPRATGAIVKLSHSIKSPGCAADGGASLNRRSHKTQHGLW